MEILAAIRRLSNRKRTDSTVRECSSALEHSPSSVSPSLPRHRPRWAVITFTQLADDIFVVSHRVKVIGLRGKAMKLVYEKTASLCVAAGYTHFEILGQESETGQRDDSANASIRAQFFLDDGDGRVECERNASSEYIEQARQKLAKDGYQPPERGPVAPAADTPASGDACSIEQIAAMARAGLSDEQIKAACASCNRP